MSDSPLVSIIMPTYNYGHYLEEALRELREQSYSNWECIVVDDGSKDNTREILEILSKEDHRFIYIHQENKGPNAARNRGLRMAKGTFIQLLDADDKIEREKLSLQVNDLVREWNLDIVYSSVRYFTNDNPGARYSDMMDQPSPIWMTNLSGDGKSILADLLVNNRMVINAPLIRKSVFDRVGSFDENFRAVEDWDFWLRCAMKDLKFKYDGRPETWALVRLHPASSSADRKFMMEGTVQLRKKLNEIFRQEGKESEKFLELNNKLLHLLYSDNICEDIENGKVLKGWRATLRSGWNSDFPLLYIRNALKYSRKLIKRKLKEFF